MASKGRPGSTLECPVCHRVGSTKILGHWYGAGNRTIIRRRVCWCEKRERWSTMEINANHLGDLLKFDKALRKYLDRQYGITVQALPVEEDGYVTELIDQLEPPDEPGKDR